MPNDQTWENQGQRANPPIVLSGMYRSGEGDQGGSSVIYTFSAPDGVGHLSEITVTASEPVFGSKAQAAPIVHRLGGTTWIDGVPSSVEAGLPEDAPLHGTEDAGANTAVFRNITLHEAGAEVIISRDRPMQNSDSHWRFDRRSIMGTVDVVADSTTDDNLRPSARMYLGCQRRHNALFGHIWRVKYTNAEAPAFSGITDGFEKGEPVTIASTSGRTMTGNILAVESDTSTISMAFDDYGWQASDWTTATVTGANSNAVANCDGSLGIWAVASSGKPVRIDQTRGNTGGGISSFTTYNGAIHLTAHDGNASPTEQQRIQASNRGLRLGRVSGWQHWSKMIDASGTTGRLVVRYAGVTVETGGLTRLDLRRDDRGFQLFNFGNDFAGGSEGNGRTDIDDFYFDGTPQRVMLGSEPTLAACAGRLYHQRVTAWNDAAISIALNLGDLDPQGPLYLYIWDETDNCLVSDAGLAIRQL